MTASQLHVEPILLVGIGYSHSNWYLMQQLKQSHHRHWTYWIVVVEVEVVLVLDVSIDIRTLAGNVHDHDKRSKYHSMAYNHPDDHTYIADVHDESNACDDANHDTSYYH